ncbi:activating transcription factor of chaperone isoform X2 [Toxorhynchites rutilus septentrionalis]|uniref:activating transcription factor of chaperone isoform X2 n=1 Tax=Toxorhynchites rutilus septentrionalis TaxID=329112 RepID=UPI00247A2360|nr:activating transcription factor of chaperone isoform X2 [Toxorhynchites rutilus septentrionalis]
MNDYDQWLGEKLKLPQLAAGSYVTPSPPSAIVAVAPEIGPYPHQQQPVKVQNTEELLMEFYYVYENVELTHLTPPQTPPQDQTQFGSQPEQSQPSYVAQQPPQQQANLSAATASEYYGFGAPMNGLLVNSIQTIGGQSNVAEPLQQVPGQYPLADSFGFQPVDEVENIARNLELVEEIVRSRSKDLPDCNDDDDSCSFSETGSVSSSSPMSDSSSSYCGSAYSRDQDDEWSPSSGKKHSFGKISGNSSVKKRTRPYGRGVEDKKSRKKEQNKNAATRYRQKKKAEIEEILIEESKLKDRNDELKSKSADIGREIRYLKSLMREVCKAKGLI